ncbi:Transcription elongation regulator 1 [Dissostichus eleginoides]|uniref:Transcription elongation regulator 1 n=1 Tax=Dissostichus eleginoides TaxID=100907 RepID=A0AAD9BVC9_DISEL|nr:Transcription elongation regulator 1 [Dissostichus eleginoides]
MSEDNPPHYRLDPSDRLNGLGGRRKRPKKVTDGEPHGRGLQDVVKLKAPSPPGEKLCSPSLLIPLSSFPPLPRPLCVSPL